MAKPEWGTKRVCTACGARFYDLNKDPIVCPKCGAENEKDAAPKVRRGGKGSRNDAVKKVAVAAPVEEEEIEEDIIGEEDDDALIEDASDLGEDDDDMAEVMDHLEPGEQDE